MVSWLAATLLAAIAVVHGLTADQHLLSTLIHAVAPLALLPALPLLGPAVLHRRWPLAVLLGLEGALGLWWLRPPPGAGPAPTDGIALRLVTANLLRSNPGPQDALDALDALDADVLLLQEVSPAFGQALIAPAHVRRWPTRKILTQHDSFGIAVLSRLPGTIERVEVSGVPWLRARLRLGDVPVEILDVHPLPPVSTSYHQRWRAQHAQLRALATGAGHRIVAGDLNATHHHPTLQQLLETTGLLDTAAACGRRQPTWPDGLRLLRLDHVLVSPTIQCVDLQLGPSIASDHRPVVADLVIPAHR